MQNQRKCSHSTFLDNINNQYKKIMKVNDFFHTRPSIYTFTYSSNHEAKSDLVFYD